MKRQKRSPWTGLPRFAPGPWSWSFGFSGNMRIEATVMDADGKPVAYVAPREGMDGDGRDGNSHLIEAAPDLFAVVAKLLDQDAGMVEIRPLAQAAFQKAMGKYK